jgi:trehalose 6-phosphate synthase
MTFSKESVKKLVKEKLREYKFILVSNREPYIHMHTPEGVKCKKPVGGLTAALDPLMQTCGGTWIAGGSGDADRENVDSKNRVKVPPENPMYILKRVWMSKDEVDKFYFGFSNQTLWPLCHSAVFQRPSFKLEFWEGYIHSNELYANSTLEEISKEKKVFIWFQDYHLALAPKIVRDLFKGNKLVTAQFWHIPWPPWEVFMSCPWAKELLEGLLANDLIGFHIQRYCKNFLSTVENTLPDVKVDHKKQIIKYKRRKIFVKDFPISVDFEAIDRIARSKEVEKEISSIRSPNYIPYKYIGVGVDRIDYTKGIPERLEAIDKFLEKYPSYQKNFVYIEAGAPSRTRIPAYMKLNEDIRELVQKINWKYQSGYWKPIWYMEGALKYERLLALYRTADVCIISPLQDGMNLVVKEFIAANVDHRGVLIMSQFAGATEELKDALKINPYDKEGFADMIYKALKMSKKEKKKRSENLRKVVKERNIYKWLNDFLIEVGKVLS